MISSQSSLVSKPDILVVDDTRANLQVLSGLLQERGYKVRPVTSGLLALQAARNQLPDLIILDIKMPEMDGYEVCRQLKADPQLREIPVIFLSALDETTDKVQAFREGGVDYITKPFQIEEVEARVSIHLRLKRLQRELAEQNSRLEDLVQERTRQLAEANSQLAVLDQVKDSFLRLISHELRSPLSGVIGTAELVFRKFRDQPDVAKLRELFDLARDRIIGLTEDALLLADMDLNPDAGAADTCSLSQVLQAAMEQTESLAQVRSVQLPDLLVLPHRIRGREPLMIRALHSLLETAVKFSSQAEALRLNVVDSEDKILLTIEATGWSIPPELLPVFFDRLAVDSSIAPGGDLGLAPAVAQRLVVACGGSLRVENTTPRGIRIEVELLQPKQPRRRS